MSKEKVKGRGLFIFLCIAVFIVVFGISVGIRLGRRPSWAKEYTVVWSDEIGTLKEDISYHFASENEGDEKFHKFDLYLPADNTKESYGLAVYIHAGGFTTGDKADDKDMLAWLCSKGYVAAGINYTLRDEDHTEASVLSQSNEIKASIPVVTAEAKKLGYNLDKMVISGGSAGGTLAMLYAYRDAPKLKPEDGYPELKMMFEAVGPSSFFAEDWGVYGLDKSAEAAAGLFGVMAGEEITEEEIESNNYQDKVKPISGWAWVNENSVPTVIAYGAHDKVCPFKSAKHLVDALEENGVDYKYYELPHSGHALQNDDKIYKQYMDSVKEYLEKYLPV